MEFFGSILVLIFFTPLNCQSGFYLVQDDGLYEDNDLIVYLNEQRLNISNQIDQNLCELTSDESLIAMAQSAMKTCDDGDKEVEGFSKIRFSLSMDLSVSQFSVDIFDEEVVENFVNNSISKAGDLPETDLDKLFQATHTRIGCAFKVCTHPPGCQIFNQLCFLGSATQESPPTDCPGMCKESPISHSTLQERLLALFNSRRRAFAKNVSASNMYKMTWSLPLANNALKIAQKCPKTFNQTHFEETIYFESEFLPIAPEEQGKEAADRYLYSRQQVIEKDPKLLIHYHWNHTKIGCAHAPASCGKVVCVIGSGRLNNQIFKKGKLCSLCSGKCDDGLCLGEPVKEEKEQNGGSLTVHFSRMLIVIELLVILLAFQ